MTSFRPSDNFATLDTDRRVEFGKSYEQFVELVSSVDVTPPKYEVFPRPNSSSFVPSYGIISVFMTDDTISYFMTKRRTTIEFSEFVNCGPRKTNMYEYLSLMTKRERGLLQDYTFNKIWGDLHVDVNSLPKFLRVAKSTTEKIFRAYKDVLPDLLRLTSPKNKDPRKWEFPKGRKNSGKDQTCLESALREFSEEAGHELDCGNLLLPDSIFVPFKGTDDVTYSTSYFVIGVDKKFYPKITKTPNNVISNFMISADMETFAWHECSKSSEWVANRDMFSERINNLMSIVHDKLRVM